MINRQICRIAIHPPWYCERPIGRSHNTMEGFVQFYRFADLAPGPILNKQNKKEQRDLRIGLLYTWTAISEY